MIESFITIEICRPQSDNKKTYKFPYLSFKEKKEGRQEPKQQEKKQKKEIRKTKQQEIQKSEKLVFCSFDNIKTVTQKIFTITRIDPREQVLHFITTSEIYNEKSDKDLQEEIYPIYYNLSTKNNDQNELITFPLPAPSKDEIKSVSIDSKLYKQMYNGDLTVYYGRSQLSDFIIKKNLHIKVFQLLDYLPNRSTLSLQSDNTTFIENTYYGFIKKYSLIRIGQFTSFIKGVRYGEEDDEDFHDDLVQKFEQEAYLFSKQEMNDIMSFSFSLDKLKLIYPPHSNLLKENKINSRHLLDSIDFDNMQGINNINTIVDFRGQSYLIVKKRKVTKTEGIILPEKTKISEQFDIQTQAEKKHKKQEIQKDLVIPYSKQKSGNKLNFVINDNFIIHIYEDLQFNINYKDTQSLIISSLDDFAKQGEQINSSIQLQIDYLKGLMEKENKKLNTENYYIIFAEVSFVLYSHIIGSSSDSKTIAHVIRFFEEIGIVKKSQQEDKFIIQRVKDNGVEVMFKKTNRGVKIKTFNLNLQQIQQLFILFRILFKQLENIKAQQSAFRTDEFSSTLFLNDQRLFRDIRDGYLYSRLCQQKNQPIIITKEEYERLDADPRTKRSVSKYINITRGLDEQGQYHPAYYKCPTNNKKYLYYLTGYQSDGFCLPCCKKLKQSESVKMIMNQCEKTGKFEGEKKRVGSYVIKSIHLLKENRISELPRQLIYLFPRKSYIVGVRQELNGFMIGKIYSCAFIAQLDVFDFVKEAITYYTDKRLRQSLLRFFSIKEENILKYYNDVKVFLDDLSYIMLYVFGIDLCIIEQEGYISTLNSFVDKKGIIICHGHDNDIFHPIVKLKPERYHETGMIKASTFEEDEIFILRGKSKRKTTYYWIHEELTSKGYEIQKLYVQNKNVYALLAAKKQTVKGSGFKKQLKYDDNKYTCKKQVKGGSDKKADHGHIYLPVENIPTQLIHNAVEFSEIPFNNDVNLDTQEILKFIQKIGGQMQYILKDKQENIIGIVQNDLLYYVQNMSPQSIKIISQQNAKTLHINVDVFKINSIMHEIRIDRNNYLYMIHDDDKKKIYMEGMIDTYIYDIIKLQVWQLYSGKQDAFHNKNQKDILDILKKQLKFQVGDYDLITKAYNNTLTSCIQNPKQGFCSDDNTILIRKENDANKYLEILSYEIMKSPIAFFMNNTSNTVIDYLSFDYKNAEVQVIPLEVQ